MGLNFYSNQELERLFLLELLVDNVQFNFSKTDFRRSFINTIQKTCVRFYFRDYPPLEVTEEDFCPITNIEANQKLPFKSGKACLFSLQDLPQELEHFEVGAEVYGEGEEPPRVLLARTCINLGELFKNVINEVYSSCQAGPVTRAAKHSYVLVGDNGVDVGNIVLFVRVSCFGKKIDGSKMNPCSDLGGIGDRGTNSEPAMMSSLVLPSGDLSYTGGSVHQQYVSQQGLPTTSSLAVGMQATGVGAMGGAMQGSGTNLGMASGATGSLQQGMGGYPAGGAGGYIPMGSGYPGMSGGMFPMGSGMPGMGGGMPGMGGGVPGMGGGMSGMGGGMAGGMPGMGGVVPGMSGGMFPMGGMVPGMAGIDQNGQLNAEIDETEEECPGEKKEKLTQEELDKDKDVLKLAIGNKRKLGNKPKIEIVLKTPKLKFDEVKVEERETQYLESDIILPKPSTGKKGGKGGKGKGGKGGKKGKKGKGKK